MDGLLPTGVDIATVDYGEESNNTFIAGNGQIIGMDDGFLAVKQTVLNILNTERYKYQIYSSNYGVSFADLIGKDRDFVRATLPERVKDAFALDDRVQGVRNFAFSFAGDTCTVTFDVATVYGTFEQEVEI